jgi:apolipoprotein N-acyltransferase
LALPTPILAPGLTSLMILALVPGGFALLASLATRALGFAPIILALLWMLAEAVLAPLGLRGGLLAGAQVDMGWSAWIAQFLGYVFVAFAIVYANASLLALLGHMSIRLPTAAVCALADVFSIHFIQQTDQPRSVTIFRSHPARAPPVPC